VEPHGGVGRAGRFPAEMDAASSSSSEASFCEPEVLHWHDLESGFAGRQSLVAGVSHGDGRDEFDADSLPYFLALDCSWFLAWGLCLHGGVRQRSARVSWFANLLVGRLLAPLHPHAEKRKSTSAAKPPSAPASCSLLAVTSCALFCSIIFASKWRSSFPGPRSLECRPT